MGLLYVSDIFSDSILINLTNKLGALKYYLQTLKITLQGNDLKMSSHQDQVFFMIKMKSKG